MASHSTLDSRPLSIWFEPRTKDGTIVCHRKNADGHTVRPIIYDIDSLHPDTSLMSEEEAQSWHAARELLGWTDRQPVKTRHF
jgi:hypothetical protein